MSAIPFVCWALAVVAGVVIYIVVAIKIEKSGLKRLGATGNLFTCNPDAEEEKKTKREKK
ncbi:MAG: hypothetical protein VB112_00500 [Oscillospiraceae bacterium]|nr:hypothetical protein [Oscillospiraceae bacterium]